MLTEMPKVGEKVRYIGGYFNDHVTLGHVYEINEVSHQGAFFIDDDNTPDNRSFIRQDYFDCFELVTESAPSIVDLLANLGRRLSEIEAELEDAKDRKYYDDMVEAYADFPEISIGRREQAKAEDAVNSPQHYKRGKYETIEVIEHITAGYDDPFVAYCVGNTIKYLDRAPYKHDSPAECLRKAAWYIMRAAEHVDKQAEASE